MIAPVSGMVFVVPRRRSCGARRHCALASRPS
jgi:hypothetical protein